MDIGNTLNIRLLCVCGGFGGLSLLELTTLRLSLWFSIDIDVIIVHMGDKWKGMQN